MLNLESKRNNQSNPIIKLSTREFRSNNEIKSIFTLNDGINLLRSNKCNPMKNFIKLPSLNINNNKNNLDKNDKFKKQKNILNIDLIKGKSIFNNSILDNVLGTINITNDEMLKDNIKNKNNQKLLKINDKNFTIRDKTPQNLKYHLDLKSQTILNFNRNKNNEILSNYDQEKNSNRSVNKNEKENMKITIFNKKISSSEDNFYNSHLLTIDSNYEKRSEYGNNLCFLNENKNKRNTKLIKKGNNHDSIGELEYKLYEKAQDMNFSTTMPYMNSNNYNESKCLSTSIHYDLKSKALLHNKELKFEFFKQNKLLDNKISKNNNISSYLQNNIVKLDPIKNLNEKKLNLIENTNKTTIMEASTQTRYNITSVFEEKTQRTLSDYDNIERIIHEKSENNLRNISKEEFDNYAKKEKKRYFNQNCDEESNNSDKRTHTKFNRLTSMKNEYNSKFILGDSNLDIYVDTLDNDLNDEYAQSKFYNRNETKFKDKNIYTKSTNNYNKTNKSPNIFSYISNSKFLIPIENEKHSNKINFSKNSISVNNRSKFTSYSTNIKYSKMKNIDRLGDADDFTKELSQNSKILRENFINSSKIKNKSQTSYRVDNPNTKKLTKIKFSKNVKMKKLLMEMIAPINSEEIKFMNKIYTQNPRKERLIQKLPLIDFKM